MTIAATRMYRGLDDFLSSDMYVNLHLHAICVENTIVART